MNTQLLRETLEITLASDDAFPAIFYVRLFEAHPEVRALFTRNSPGAMNKKFAQTLSAIIDNIEDQTWMKSELPLLVAKHVSYGVTNEMYAWVGDALIATIAAACGDTWTPTAESAWREAYAALSAEMTSR
ncbi:MAG TPA: globin domain-containing protein [Kofleriaceae bacterium]|jgi:hemoglobin-like flavoprotein